MTRKRLATLLVIVGGLLAALGLGLIYLPAALIVSGAGLVGYGLVGVEIER